MKNTTRIIRLLIFGGFIFAALLWVFARTHVPVEPDIKDGGFLSGEPCGPPCFLSIVPGVTRETQAVKILAEKGLYQNCFSYNNEAESGLRGISCSFVGIAYYRGTDVIGSVSFNPSRNLTVEDVVTKYGNPDAVVVGTMGTPEEQPHTMMALHYESMHANIGLGEQEGLKFNIASTTPIETIGYSDSGWPSPSEYESANKLSSPWSGYGEYHETPIR